MAILEANKSKSFVQRILDPNKVKPLNLGGGSIATHKMAWTEADGKYRVYPTVLWDGKKLFDYGQEGAYDQVLKSGNYIDFDNPQDADWFSKNYKVVWGNR